jgi:hypothetical protein
MACYISVKHLLKNVHFSVSTTLPPTLTNDVKEGTLNREQATDCFKWGFRPHLKRTTYRSRGLRLPEGIGNRKTVKSSLFPIPFFDKTVID